MIRYVYVVILKFPFLKLYITVKFNLATAYSLLARVLTTMKLYSTKNQQTQNQSRFAYSTIIDQQCYKACSDKSEETEIIHNIRSYLGKSEICQCTVADMSCRQSGHHDFHNILKY